MGKTFHESYILTECAVRDIFVVFVWVGVWLVSRLGSGKSNVNVNCALVTSKHFI